MSAQILLAIILGTVTLHQHLHQWSLCTDDSARYESIFRTFVFVLKRRRSVIKGTVYEQNNCQVCQWLRHFRTRRNCDLLTSVYATGSLISVVHKIHTDGAAINRAIYFQIIRANSGSVCHIYM